MSQKKTIWIINQYSSTPETGVGGRHYYFAKSLAQLGYEVYLVGAAFTHLLREPPVLENNFKVEPIAENFNFVWVKMPTYAEAHSKKRIANWFSFAWKITNLKNILPKPDVILYSSPSLVGYLGAEKLARDLSVPLAFEVRDIWPLTLCELGGYSENHPFIRLLQWIEDRAYKNSDFVLSNLKKSYEHMQSRGMKPEKFAWVPNGFLKEEVENAQPLEQSTLDQLPKDKFIVGYAGTLGIANALDSFIRAANELKVYSEIAFVLVGNGKLKQSLQQQVEELGLTNVYFVDAIPKRQVQSLLKVFNVCYIGLTKDPLFRFGVSPNKLFDYLYAGKPVLYAIDSGPYTPVADSQAGIQIEPENVADIVEGVLKLYNLSSEERAIMGSNGHQEAVQSYEYGSLTKKLASILFKE
ncbi:glycosyltransferase family 4 protein [Acinetobacter sp. CWB-G5]|uniref:glycosyltransferase family 4 protein n=1 Tax=Acinetobacter sp. CWB-G5 TaxID=2855444 RepID=UPI001C490A93|nr:glycosyltransferase family 4 protein [Acinetobacter sp. CWB-G5]MBV7309552.1 glycosyltransferase family 4 protein [Acinetobacter sp. CWB-G5]